MTSLTLKPAAASATVRSDPGIEFKTGFRTPNTQPDRINSGPDNARIVSDQRTWLQERAGTTAGLADIDLRAECEARDPQASSGPAGWLRDRMLSCTHRRPYVKAIVIATGEEVGELEFDLWVLGFANHGARQVDYLISVENITHNSKDPIRLSWPATTLQGVLLGCPGAPHVNCADQAQLTDVVLGWQHVPSRGVTYSSDNNVGSGDFFTVPARIQLDFNVVHPPGSEIIPGIISNAFESEIRFDSGGQSAMGRAHGSVFVRAPLVYRLWLSSATHPKSALHIYDALNRPQRTFPSWPNKSVPGGSMDRPLTRLVDPVRTQNNRNFTTVTCKDVWGPDYARGGLECDEFPFASTYQGGLTAFEETGERRYSVRPILAADNNDAGGNRLKAFYQENRIIDKEAFYVSILP